MNNTYIQCRSGCGACCIYISISSSIPGHPNGKKAGEVCKNLDKTNKCSLFNTIDFPNICKQFAAVKWICGDNYDQAVKNIIELEKLTSN